MTVIDTSALVAIFQQESERDAMSEAIVEAGRRIMPVHVYLEYSMVTAVHSQARPWLDGLVERLGIEMLPTGLDTARIAADAFLRYGKGRGHPAQLNLADCMSYAVAKHLDMPLLYKGGDFGHTDIESALSR